MLRYTRGRRIRQAFLAALLPVSFAGCDGLLVDPSAPATSLALSLSPSSPSFAIAPENADSIRVQIRTEGEVLFDDRFAFDPALEEVLVPVRFSGSETGVEVLVEISDGGFPLLRGSGFARLLQRRVVEAEIAMEEAFIRPLDSVYDLSAGVYHTCSVGDNNLSACWGVNDEGQLGDRTLDPAPIATAIDDFYGFYAVSAGLLSTCAIGGEGQGYCWGSNRFGGLGVGASTEYRATPTPISGEIYFTQISVGGLHACGLSRGTAYCWGYNRWGQLGDGSTTNRFTPVPVASQFVFESISAGYAHTCGVVAEVGVYCWGLNSFGQLGDGTTTDRSTPTRLAGQFSMYDVSAGGLHTCGIGGEGNAYCWGFNRTGQLGNNGSEDSSMPQPVAGSFSDIVAGGLHTCGIARDESGEASCWGFNRSGALGDGTDINRAAPVPVSGSHAYLQLSAGLHHTCGVTVDRNVLCWGYNRFGQVGDGTYENRLLPEDALVGDRFFFNPVQQQPGFLDLQALLGSMADGRTLN